MNITIELCACLLAPAWLGTASAPTLVLTSAPQVGHPIEVRIESPGPHAQAFLLASPQPGAIPLPFGTLELAPAGLVLLASGSTGAGGALSLSFPTQSTADAAEAEVHAQAVVLDPLTASLAATNALHFRLLAGRAYVGSRAGSGATGELRAVSAVSGAALFTRAESFETLSASSASSSAGSDELPLLVVSGDGSRAAYVADGPRLVIFDNFFGGTLHEIPLLGLAPQLALDASGSRVFALQTSAGLLTKIDLASGTVVGSLALAELPSAQWTVSDDRRWAFLARAGAAGAAARVLRVDLATLSTAGSADLFAAPSAQATPRIDDLGWGAGRLIAAGSSSEFGGGPQWKGFLASLDWAQQPPSIASASTSGSGFVDLLVAPALGGALAVQNAFFLYGISFVGFPLTDPAAFAPFAPAHPFASSGPPILHCDGARLWVRNDDTWDSSYQLFSLDLASWSWKQHWPSSLCYPGPFDLGRVQDALSDTLALSVWTFALACGGADGQLVLMDANTDALIATHALAGAPVLLETTELD